MPPTIRRSSTRSTPGISQIANGPFSPAQVGHLDDTGFPLKQDMAKAQELVASYKAEHPGPLEISLSTTQDATNLIIAQAQQQFFTEAGFDDVQISQIEQAKYILTALQGDFQAFQWRNHGGYDLDYQYIWWTSQNAFPPGQLALNFGRIKDPVIDENLAANRGETDPAKKQQYAESDQQAIRGAVLQPLGLVDRVGSSPRSERHGRRRVHQPGRHAASPGTGGYFNVRSVWIDPNA